MQKRSTLILIVVFALLLVGAVVLYRTLGSSIATDLPALDQSMGSSENESNSQAAPITIPAPNITLYHLDGTAAQFSDFVGKPIVLNFWSSNCGPCRTEMPDFQTAYEQLGDEVQFLMINVTDNYWDTLETASSYVAEEGFTFPVLYDLDNHAAMTYGITGLPTTYFINSAGNVVAGRSGMMDLNILMGGIDLIYHP